MQLRPENCSKVVAACCILHNLLSIHRPKYYLATVADQTNPNAPNLDWQDLQTLLSLETTKGNTNKKAGIAVRKHLTDYYNSEVGAVEWQDVAVLRHVIIFFEIELSMYSK